MLPEVEYIVIPEPGALGLMLIALGTAGGFAITHVEENKSVLNINLPTALAAVFLCSSFPGI